MAGRGGLVLIGGEAGIGKTALAEWLCAEALELGSLVLVGRCYDLTETPPYGPWVELLASFADARVLPAPLGAGEIVASQAALFAAVQGQLAAESARQPLLLLLDDLHWVDPASLDLLRVLARQALGLPLLMLVTYRSDEISRRHPLFQLLPLLVRETQASQLDLRALPDEAVRDLVQARYPLPLSDQDRLVSYLRERAEGHPFFLGELLKTLEEVGDLGTTGDGWRLGDLSALRVPRLLRQVVEGRLARLPDKDQHLLAVAAVIGQEVPLDLWASLADVSEDALLEVVERAMGARLVEETSDGARARFLHALIREALYEGTTPSRRRAWHRRAGEELAATRAPDPDAVAHHFRHAGDPRAVDWLSRAGHRARRAVAPRIAADRYDLALTLLPADGDPAQHGWLLLHLSLARYHDDPHAGIGYLSAAIRLANEASDRALAAYARYQLGFHLTGIGDYRQGLPEMADGVAALEALTDEDQRRIADLGYGGGDYLGTFAQRLVLVGRCEEAQALALQANARGDENNAFFTLAEIHGAFGRVAEALAFRERGYATLQARGSWLSLGIYTWCGLQRLLPFRADQLEERQRFATAATVAFTRSGGLEGEVTPRLGRLPLLALEGEWAEARALALDVEAGSRAYRPEVVSLLAELAHAQGDTALADRLIRKWMPAGPLEEPGYIFFHVGLGLQRLAATLASEAGDWATVRAWLEAHDRWLAWSGTVLGRAHGQLAWAGYYRAAGDYATARAHADSALALASDPRQPLALLAAHRLLGELATDARNYGAASNHLDAALALAEVCAAPYERALTLLAHAELRHASGAGEAAQALLDEARTILTPLEARPALARADALHATLAPVAAPAYPAGLTVREVEVLRLVAQGLTDVQVAERLYVSANTVKTHLRSIYNKLDVTSRTAAARFATDHGLA